jgi:hypothetical protein
MPTSDTQNHDEAREYYRLCNEMREAGLPTSLDDPASPTTVEGMRTMLEGFKRGQAARISYENRNLSDAW